MKKQVILGAILFVLVFSVIGATTAATTDSVTVTPWDATPTNTVPMQDTGVPLAGMVLSIVMVGSGLLMSKRMK